MALQELDILVHYRPGKANNNADALSHCTTTNISDSDVPWKVLAALQADVKPVKEGEEETLSAKQLADPEIAEVITYLEDNVLPSNEQRARELTLTRMHYEVIDDVLYTTLNLIKLYGLLYQRLKGKWYLTKFIVEFLVLTYRKLRYMGS